MPFAMNRFLMENIGGERKSQAQTGNDQSVPDEKRFVTSIAWPGAFPKEVSEAQKVNWIC